MTMRSTVVTVGKLYDAAVMAWWRVDNIGVGMPVISAELFRRPAESLPADVTAAVEQSLRSGRARK